MVLILLQAFLLLSIITDVLVSLLWIFHHRKPCGGKNKKPFVSVLVAARNEEENISSCLESLLAQEYGDFEILVGDDGSTDRTAAIALDLAKRDNRIRVHDIKAAGPSRGKANALAQLAGFAGGEVFFFTDADVKVPKTWISSLLKGFDEKTGLVSGVTGVEGDNLWAEFQHLDWVIAIGMVKVVSDLGFPVTALGNNMAITRKSYEAVGGFGTIPFSITEDFEILRHIAAKGFSSTAIFNPAAYAVTAPEPNGIQLLHQRKRWMKGAFQLSPVLVFLLAMQALFCPLLILMALVSPGQALFLFLFKIFSQSIFACLVSARIGKKVYLKTLIFYEIYAGVLSLVLPLFYILPIKIKWKGREY